MRHSQTDRLPFRKCEQRFQGKGREDPALTLNFCLDGVVVWTVLVPHSPSSSFQRFSLKQGSKDDHK
jgi:hypothetical protein